MAAHVQTHLPTSDTAAHELVGWESRVHWQLLCLVAIGLCTAPLLLAQLGLPLRLPAERITRWLATREARELTGYVSGGIVLFQASLGIAKRALRGQALQLWRSAHQVLPIALLFTVLLHTRGNVGVNLNRWLITALLVQVYLVQAGHLMKAIVAEHATTPGFDRLDRVSNHPDGVVHRMGLSLHVLLAVVVLVLLCTHLISVYYF
jgi:hypothetical protein